jgi:hypothetical protein
MEYKVCEIHLLFPSILHGITRLGSTPWLPLLLPPALQPPPCTPLLSCLPPACPSHRTVTPFLLQQVAPHPPWRLPPASLSAPLCPRPSTTSPSRRLSHTPSTWRCTTTPSGALSSPWSSADSTCCTMSPTMLFIPLILSGPRMISSLVIRYILPFLKKTIGYVFAP